MKELNSFRKYLKEEETPKQNDTWIPREKWVEKGLNKIYLDAVKLSRKGDVDAAVNKFAELKMVGVSFATKHLAFWVDNVATPVYDTRIARMLMGKKPMVKDYNSFREWASDLAPKVGLKDGIEVEKALFAFSNNYFDNDLKKFEKEFQVDIDKDEAQKIFDLRVNDNNKEFYTPKIDYKYWYKDSGFFDQEVNKGIITTLTDRGYLKPNTPAYELIYDKIEGDEEGRKKTMNQVWDSAKKLADSLDLDLNDEDEKLLAIFDAIQVWGGVTARNPYVMSSKDKEEKDDKPKTPRTPRTPKNRVIIPKAISKTIGGDLYITALGLQKSPELQNLKVDTSNKTDYPNMGVMYKVVDVNAEREK